jgi:hypothetical protein
MSLPAVILFTSTKRRLHASQSTRSSWALIGSPLSTLLFLASARRVSWRRHCSSTVAELGEAPNHQILRFLSWSVHFPERFISHPHQHGSGTLNGQAASGADA